MTAAPSPSPETDESPQPGPPVPYAAAEIQDLLRRLIKVVPTISTLRTDRFKGEELGPGNPQRVIIEYGDNEQFKLALATEEGGSPHFHIAGKLKLDDSTARYVLRIVKHIASLNRLGAWCIAPTDVDEFVLTAAAIGDKRLGEHSYLRQTCQFLAEDLPNVGAICIDYQLTQFGPQQRGQQRRRAFLRFLAPDGVTEVAALDAAGFALHARHQLLEPEGESLLDLNLYRMAHWSQQLDVSPEVLAETFGTLTFLTSALHITRIQLR